MVGVVSLTSSEWRPETLLTKIILKCTECPPPSPRPCEKADSVSLRGGLRFGISNRLPGDDLAAGPLNPERNRGQVATIKHFHESAFM